VQRFYVCALAFAVTLIIAAGTRAETPGIVVYGNVPPWTAETKVYRDIGPLARAADQPPAAAIAPDPLAGFHYGIGVGVSSNLGGIGAVSKDPTTNIVRITRDNPAAARGLFEIHYYIPTKSLYPTAQTVPGFYTALGPYISLNTAPIGGGGETSQLFDSIGMGLMFGIQGGGCDKNNIVCNNELYSFNIGIGALIDTNVQQLRTGVIDNQPSAIPQDQLLSKTTKIGFQVLFSYKLFSFNLK
jgi:hypothetical protein